MNGLPKIERLHAWIIVDDDGTEGIPMVQLPGIGPAALMCGDQPGAIAAFDRAAQMAADQLGKPVKHCTFEHRFVEKTLHPVPKEGTDE